MVSFECLACSIHILSREKQQPVGLNPRCHDVSEAGVQLNCARSRVRIERLEVGRDTVSLLRSLLPKNLMFANEMINTASRQFDVRK